MKREQRNTLILAAVLLAVLGAALLIQRLQRGPDSPVAWAVVQVGGREPQRLDLAKDTELRVGDEEIGYNLVRVEDGKVMVAEADCADKVCVYTGPISQPGELIACLPHGLLIYIEEAGGQN